MLYFPCVLLVTQLVKQLANVFSLSQGLSYRHTVPYLSFPSVPALLKTYNHSTTVVASLYISLATGQK
jgi:hypothetical protein